MFRPMSKERTFGRSVAACAGLLTVSGLAAVGVTSLQPAAAAVAGYQNIRINEITSDGTNRVELFNVGASAVSLANWKVSTQAGLTTLVAFAPSSASIASGGFVTFTMPGSLTLAAAGSLALFADDNVFVDRVDWATGTAAPAKARCPSDGQGSWTPNTNPTFGVSGSSNFSGCTTPLPAASLVRINEVTSSTPDTVEFFNGGTTAVDLSTWRYLDAGASDSDAVPAAPNLTNLNPTIIPAGGYATFNNGAFGLSAGGDSVVLLDGAGNTIDSVTYPSNAAVGSYERCPNGSSSGVFATSTSSSFGTPTGVLFPGGANTCGGSGGGPVGPVCTSEAVAPGVPSGVPDAWPGPSTAAVVDNQCAFLTPLAGGTDISGLAFDPANSNVLWAVGNKSWLFKLIKSGGKWIPDASFSANGKELDFLPGGSSGTAGPDTEGITVGRDGNLFITTERDNAASGTPRNTILEFNPNAAGSILSPLRTYDVTKQFSTAGADANLGFEGIGFVPDTWLVANQWIDPRTDRVYNPAIYPLHGAGLYFGALEKNGNLYAYALNSDGSLVFLGTVGTGQRAVQDVFYDARTQRLVATCDNTCGVTHTFMKIADGKLVVDKVYTKPSAVPMNNLEGFALSQTCTGGLREALWSDDGNYGNGPGDAATFQHSLWGASFPC